MIAPKAIYCYNIHMQGYILNINKVKEEDLIVSILTEDQLLTLYRFYGARHANVQLGFKIDFEAIPSAKSSISMLREVLPLSMKWMFESKRFFIWQQFCKLMYTHLKDIIEIDPFYYYLLEKSSLKMSKQDPERTVIEAYLELLAFEGRLHDDFVCFICDQEIEKELTLARSFLPAHKSCVWGDTFSKKEVNELFQTHSTLYLSKQQVSQLWQLLQAGF